MSRKLTTGFARKSDNDFVSSNEHVLSCMTDNPLFPNPVPPLPTIRTLNDGFKEFIARMLPGNKRDIIERGRKREELKDAMMQLSRYVSMISKDDPDMILSSGFPLSKERESRIRPEPPVIKKITDGKISGEVIITLMPDPKSRQSNVAYKPETEIAWIFKSDNSKRIIVLEDLKFGVVYTIKVAAINSAGQGDWSQEHKFLVR